MTLPVPLAASVVVPTRDRHRLLHDTLLSLLAQTLPRDLYEVLVVDDGSDIPVEVPDGVRLVRHERARGLNAARNTGVTEARAELVCLVDDDIDAPPGWLGEFVEGAVRNPDTLCFGGPIRLRVEAGQPRACPYCNIWETQLDLGDAEGPTDSPVYGANFGLRKEAFRTAGLFDEDRPIHYEEVEWQDRLRRRGEAVVYLPNAWLWHRRTEDATHLRKHLVKSFQQGRGEAYYYRDRGLPLPIRPRGAPRAVLHGMRHHCDAGFLDAAHQIGAFVGVAQVAWRRSRSRSRSSTAS